MTLAQSTLDRSAEALVRCLGTVGEPYLSPPCQVIIAQLL